jgi:glycosyltransferase involved in cell wall biosynthesis
MASILNDRVIIVSNSISGGGAEISMTRLFDVLTTQGLDVTICAINHDQIIDIAREGISVIGRNWGSGLKETMNSFIKFRRHLMLHEPHILVVNCELPELYVALSAPWKISILVVEHTSRPWIGRRTLGFLVRSILLARQADWITVSRNQSEIWPYSSKPVFIPNSHIQDEKKEELVKPDLVFVGRLNHGKHPEIAAEAASVTLSSIVFFGDGPKLNDLEAKYKSPTTIFRGFVERPWSYISQDSIVVVPSEFEGDGMNIVEAVSNGNPILLADNADLRRFDLPDLNYFSGIEELISKIDDAKTFSRDRYRVGDNIRSRILAEREPLTVASKWISVFEDMSNR